MPDTVNAVDHSFANVERAERKLLQPRSRPGGLVLIAGGLPLPPLPPSLFPSKYLCLSLTSRCFLPRFLPLFFRRVACGTLTTRLIVDPGIDGVYNLCIRDRNRSQEPETKTRVRNQRQKQESGTRVTPREEEKREWDGGKK